MESTPLNLAKPFRLFWQWILKITFKCPFDFAHFPSDEQLCYIQPFIAKYSKEEMILRK